MKGIEAIGLIRIGHMRTSLYRVNVVHVGNVIIIGNVRGKRLLKGHAQSDDANECEDAPPFKYSRDHYSIVNFWPSRYNGKHIVFITIKSVPQGLRMRISQLLILISIIAPLSSCSSKGFNRDELRDEMNDKAPVTDSEIAKTLSLKPQLPKPFVLAVYFKEPTFERRILNQKWRWTDEDEQTILSSLDNLKKFEI
jgi:hypothetical protein